MEENDVKKALFSYIKKKHRVVKREYELPEIGRVDFISFDWKNEFEVNIQGYECKGSRSPKSIVQTLREQISEYQKIIPKMFLVLNSKKIDEIKYLCELNGIGFINVTENKKINIVHESPDPPQQQLDNSLFESLRMRAAMFLTFIELFGGEIKMGNNWCSTSEVPKEPQYNIWQNSYNDNVNFSVNLENSRRVLKRVNLNKLHKKLIELHEGYRLDAWIKKYHVPRVDTAMSLYENMAQDVELEDLKYLKKRSEKEVLHMQIKTALWDIDEILPRKKYLKKINSAIETLEPIHLILSS